MTENQKFFKLLHVAKYAKKHYLRTDDIWADLKLCLRADDYTPDDNNDILGIISTNMYPLLIRDEHTIAEFIKYCAPDRTWEIGYYTKQSQEPVLRKGLEKENLPDYDYWTAVLYSYMLILRFSGKETFGVDKMPESCIPELRIKHSGEPSPAHM